jgi:hypothetical protein
MTALSRDIAAFEGMRKRLEADHFGQWAVFQGGVFVAVYADFETAAGEAVDRFDAGPYLIRQVGAGPIQLSGGMVFTPSHALGPGRH